VSVTREIIEQLMAERLRKVPPSLMGYQKAPDGSAMKCGICFHGFRRASDGFMTCELVDEDELEGGINPTFRCQWWTSDGAVYVLSPEVTTEHVIG
jgi:hypothetical protein